MGIKELLGLESLSLNESEIMGKLREAYRNKTEIIEFSSKGKIIKVKLKHLSPEGLMKGDFEYYSAK